jgi:TolB-like protein/tetratricopeptide (TPR) repeat protein
MRVDAETNAGLEIGHVLFIDIVGYSKRTVDEQKELVTRLNELVRNTAQFRSADAAGKLIRIPTGDGMALAFFTSPDAPVHCAIQLAKADQADPKLELRMGIHSGPVDRLADVNERTNLAGAGMNMAQRVMDCGDAGHILLSKRAADDLAQYAEWRPRLYDLGEIEVKHEQRIGITNFYFNGIGNPALPEKLKRVARAKRRRTALWLALVSLLLVAGSVGWLLFQRARSKAALQVPEKSIAVLPLENLSDDKENAFFADGIHEDILTTLGKIKDLKVISRTSVMQYRGAARNLREIAKTLGVANVLEGSVRRSGNRVLVNVQLIDARDDRHIWTERYDRTIADSMSIQGGLAIEIAKALRAKLEPEEKAQLETKPTENSEAYVLYLKAVEREEAGSSTIEDQIATEKFYEQAIALDPEFAVAYAQASLLNSRIHVETQEETTKIKARAQAEEAVRLAPTLGDAHLALGLSLYWGEKDYGAALKEFGLAAAASPNDPQVLSYIAGIYRRQGRWWESIASLQRVQDLDPRNGPSIWNAALDYLLVRDWPAATACYNRLFEIWPDAARIGLAYLEVFRNGTPASGRDILRKIPADVDPDRDVTRANWDLAMLERDFAAAEKVLNDFPARVIDPDWPKSAFLGQVALARGDAASAQRFFLAAAPELEARARDHSNEALNHEVLGLIYSYMGRKEDAIREARRAVELEPESQDAFHGALHNAALAQVYALSGEADQAITLIERLLTIPGPVQLSLPQSITLAELRLRWEWDSLRNNPRFQKILAGPEPKTIY